MSLVNGTTYAITLRGINTEGQGTISNSVNGTPNVPAAPDIADYSATLGAGLFGTIAAPTNSGGAITSWSISPSLPSGLTLSSTGVISGSVATATAATEYTVTATNSSSVSDTAILTLTISATIAPSIDYAGTPYQLVVDEVATVTPTSSGGAATSWAVTSGTLPSGLSINSSTGVISGTPDTVADAVTITVTATGTYGTDTSTFTIAIVNGGSPSYSGPVMTSVNPSPMVADTIQAATVFGLRLDSITSMTVDGLPVEIARIGDTQIEVTFPPVAAGIYDLVAIYGGGGKVTAVNLAKFEASAEVGPEEEIEPIRVVVTGFRPGISTPSAFQINKLKAAIAAIKEPITGMTCIGFTNGPTVLPVDPQVALARGKFICDYLKEVLPGLPQKLTFKNTTYPSIHWRRAEVYFKID